MEEDTVENDEASFNLCVLCVHLLLRSSLVVAKPCKIIAQHSERQESRSWIFTLQFFEVKLRWFLTPSVPQQLFLAMMNITVNPKLHSESSCSSSFLRWCHSGLWCCNAITCRTSGGGAASSYNHPSFFCLCLHSCQHLGWKMILGEARGNDAHGFQQIPNPCRTEFHLASKGLTGYLLHTEWICGLWQALTRWQIAKIMILCSPQIPSLLHLQQTNWIAWHPNLATF